MKCEIISVGTEVLTGDIIDTNAPYISKGGMGTSPSRL